jgi:peptidoglycan/LPS O-acetylase OafA/YrhL
LNRIFVPYWAATVLILLADYFLLERSYSAEKILSTLIGLNFDKTLRFLDYTRWFITLLLIFYVAFMFFVGNLNTGKALIGVSIFALFLYVLRRTSIFPFGSLHHFAAFPLGCWMAYSSASVETFVCKGRYSTLIYTGISVASIFILKLGLETVVRLGLDLPNAVVSVIHSTQGVLFCIAIVLLVTQMSRWGYSSRFLSFCGVVSYELYLIHGPLLIKYNPVFGLLPGDFVWLTFCILLALTLLMAYAMNFWLDKLAFKL